MKRIQLLFATILAMFLMNSLVFGQQDTTLTIDSNGNVGIGTTSPQQKLEVDGNIRLTGAGEIGVGGTTNVLVLTGGTSVNAAEIDLFGSSNAFNPSHINLTTNNAIRMRVDQNGNVGIGNTSPAYKLDIEGGATPLRITGGGPQFQKFLFDVAIGGFAIFRVYDKDVNEDFRFATNGDSWLNGAGNVGIGTTSPQGKLDVNGTIYQRGGQLHADYVFEPDFKLESIREHADFMWKNKHLKAIPKAKVDENGREIVEVGAHRKGIVEELEKAHIYIDQLHNRIKTLEATLEKLAIRLDGNN